MASNSIAGYNGVVYVSSDGGTTWNAIGELQDVKLKVETKMLNATSHASGGWEESKAGNNSWSATAQALLVTSDVAQAAIEAAVIAKTLLKFRFDPYGTTTGKPRREGFGFIQSYEENQPVADLETAAITITGSGALVLSTQ